jgi:hypothetical protein
VLLMPPFSTKRSWSPRCATSTRRYCDESACCKCMFKVCMLQLFHMDVAKVDRKVAHVVYVASASEAYCKCFIGSFKMFHLFHKYVASILIWTLYIFHTYVATIYSKCFNWFGFMLQ